MVLSETELLLRCWSCWCLFFGLVFFLSLEFFPLDVSLVMTFLFVMFFLLVVFSVVIFASSFLFFWGGGGTGIDDRFCGLV